MKNLLPFEKKVLEGLQKCGVSFDSVSEASPLGVAVSGGADSVSLLLSLYQIFGSEKLRAVTVDHGIRSADESGGDALFVKDLCKSLSVKCTCAKIPEGKIVQSASSQSKSVEEVARIFRYEIFENFIKEENLLFLCLAHNQGDQLETLLMRFLQGSSGEGMAGIARVRGRFCRPLLEISRAEIESYLASKNQVWRTDATNSDVKYLRNKIRNILVPVLNENFDGWQKALLCGAVKSASDEDFIKNQVGQVLSQNPVGNILHSSSPLEKIRLPRSEFYSLHDSLKRRVFFACLNKAGFGQRFPFRLFEELSSWKDEKSRELVFENVRVFLDSESLIIEEFDSEKRAGCIESGFSFLSKNAGDCAEDGKLKIEAGDDELFLFSESQNASFKVNLPCLVRSVLPGDKILTAEGGYKNLSDILTDWKIPESLRDKVAVVEELGNNDSFTQDFPRIKAVISFHLGYKNWIVDFNKL